MTTEQPGGGLCAVNGLIDAAARGERELARRLCRELGAGSWVVAVDRFGGVRHAEPHTAAARAADIAEASLRLWSRPGSALLESEGGTVLMQTLAGDADVVLAVGLPQGAPQGPGRELVNTTAGLLRVILAAARQQQLAQAAVHACVLRLLLAGERESAAMVLTDRGGLPAEPVRFYRVDTTHTSRAAVLDLFTRAAGADGLIALTGEQLVAVVTAGGAADHRLRRTLPCLAERRLYVGTSDPVPLSRALAAHREAGHAVRAGRTAGLVLTDFGELAEQRLTGLIPQPLLLEWAASLLRPVLEHHDEPRLTAALSTWLNAHGRIATAAAELGVDRKTLERRLRLAGALLDADLRDECVRVRLLLALHALDRVDDRPPFGPRPLRADRDCLVWLLDIGKGLEWAAAVLKPLDKADPGGQLRRTLQVWLERHGDYRGTAEELGVHRNTVAKRVHRAEALTGQNLDYAGNRAELYLALLTDGRARAGTLPPEAFPPPARQPTELVQITV